MTSKLKCPVCDVPLTECGDLLFCPNDHCAWAGNAELWQAFIQSQKDLERIKIERDESVNIIKRIQETGHIPVTVDFTKY